MAQLVKLQNYISRYEMDLTHYPTQFIRLKRTQWERVKKQWLIGKVPVEWEHHKEKNEPKQPNFLHKLFRKKQDQTIESIEDEKEELLQTENEEMSLHFEPNIIYQPESIDELKRLFLDQLFHFQLKWASSTLLSKSLIDPKFYRDGFLRTMLQRLPDHYLLFYYPIMKVKNTTVELDVILITPTDCLCITIVEEEESAVYIGSGERFWIKKIGDSERKVLNPLIQLNRMEAILSEIFKQNDVNMPIRKILLSRTCYFDYPNPPYNVQLIDRWEYSSWIENLRQSTSPMKKVQVQCVQAILRNVETVSISRDYR
jgi:hypothetical protein